MAHSAKGRQLEPLEARITNNRLLERAEIIGLATAMINQHLPEWSQSTSCYAMSGILGHEPGVFFDIANLGERIQFDISDPDAIHRLLDIRDSPCGLLGKPGNGR